MKAARGISPAIWEQRLEFIGSSSRKGLTGRQTLPIIQSETSAIKAILPSVGRSA